MKKNHLAAALMLMASSLVLSAQQSEEWYAYDHAGRLNKEYTDDHMLTYTYDARGNMQSARRSGSTGQFSHTYIYDGDKVQEMRIAGPGSQQAVQFTHDTLGRMTLDGTTGQSITYNPLDLVGNITLNGTTLANYSYLSDGTKLSALDGSGEGLMYRGPFATASLPEGTTLRDGYTGKEDQTPDFSTGYTDFGARQYSQTLRRWMTPDPLSEKYYGISPYAFCNNNPVNLVDPDGRDPIYSKNFWGKVEYIGDDGKNSIGAYLVSGSVSRDVKRATKHNTYYNGDLSAGKNVIHIPTGELLNGIKKSYEDTQLSKRENGGHYNFGDTEVTRWDEGDAAISYIDQNSNKVVKASMKMFLINGENLSPSDASNVQYWWHVHPDLSIDNINLGSSNPSRADYRAQSAMNKKRYGGISFVIGAGDEKVSFFNSKRVLRTIKWSDFIKMGEQKR